jgi:peptide/nickel transport system permease protein
MLLLGLISIIAFGMSKLVPGDEILDYLSIDDARYSASADPLEQRKAYARVAAKRGFDLPLFYISFSPGYYPDSLYHILPMEDRQNVKKWINESKNKTAAIQLYKDLISGLGYACPRADTQVVADQFCQHLGEILREGDLFTVHHSILRLQTTSGDMAVVDSMYIKSIAVLNSDIETLIKSPHRVSAIAWLPVLRWHGIHNQYHQWMAGFIMFKPLTSLVDGRNAWTKILEALKWTLVLNGFAFMLSIALGIGIGIWSGTHDGHWLERILQIKLFALFALPSFWLATLFIYFFSSGEWIAFFPAGGLGPYHAAGNIFQKSGILISHLTLPVLCLAIGSLAYVSRQMKQSVMHQFRQPYVLSLRSQGVSERTILRKHIIRNAFFPLITLIGGALPALLSGSLIIEVIFSIPGMGRLMYTSLTARDWPVVFPILMFGATITVFSYILTDVVYKWADPRVKTLAP